MKIKAAQQAFDEYTACKTSIEELKGRRESWASRVQEADASVALCKSGVKTYEQEEARLVGEIAELEKLRKAAAEARVARTLSVDVAMTKLAEVRAESESFDTEEASLKEKTKYFEEKVIPKAKARIERAKTRVDEKRFAGEAEARGEKTIRVVHVGLDGKPFTPDRGVGSPIRVRKFRMG